VAELTRWFVVVIVCAGSSVLALLPVAVVGGPTQAGLALSRIVLPTASRLTLSRSMHQQQQQPDVIDSQRRSADIQQRLHLDLDLRQLVALRQLHGTTTKRTHVLGRLQSDRNN